MKKYTLFPASTGDFKAIEGYLNRQAEKGWELEKVGALFARWRRSERADLRWCVDLANPKENRDREARKDYVDFCAEGGWELLTLRNNMYFFRSIPGRNPPPVQTDPDLERKNYNKYYVRNTILSAIYILGMLAFYTFLFLVSGEDLEYTVQSTRVEWHLHWLAVGFAAAVPLWGVTALWRIADFIRALLTNRDGEIGTPPPWVMWANCVVSLLGGLGTASFFLGIGLEGILQGSVEISVFILLACWAGGLLYRSFTYEFELYKGEIRFTRNLGLAILAVFVAMIVGRVASPNGNWSTNRFDYRSNYDSTMAQYALLEELPMVRTEDLGVALKTDENDYLDLTREYTPVGERWEVEYTIWEKSMSRIGCETISSPMLFQTKLAERQMVAEVQWWSDSLNREKVSSYLVLVAPPQVELEEVELPWADSAWYGENETASVLVVRIGKQVTRLSAPLHLMTEELLPVIEGRLTK